ncbi:type I restriction endonuclease subunit R, partial [Tessaracoccus lubricantis]
GNIVSFRDLEQQTNDAIALFGNRDARGVVLLKPYADYYAEYGEKVTELLDRFPLHQQLIGEGEEKAFIGLFGAILRLTNILTAFDDFAGEQLLTDRQSQDYRSRYLDLHAQYRAVTDSERETINDDLVFEIELVKQVEINVDFILLLVEQYRQQRGDGDDKELRATITRAVDASPSLRSKKDLIEEFVDSVSTQGELDREWQTYIAARRDAELQAIIEEEQLKPAETRSFVDHAFADGSLQTAGTSVTRILPPASRFAAAGGGHAEKKNRVLARLGAFLERFLGLG